MSLRAPRRLVAAAAVPALLAGVAIAAPAAAAPAKEPDYKGGAIALQTTLSLAGTTLLDLQLPEIVSFPAGGDKNLLELPAELSDLATLEVLNASAGIKDLKFAANARTARLSVLSDVIGADLINANCVADKLDVSGTSAVRGLTLVGQKVDLDGLVPGKRIEIPQELAALVTGAITLDERNKLDDGGVQVRALRIQLTIAPAALDAALKSVSETVRAVAKQVVTAVESATGQSIDTLLGEVKGATAAADKGATATKAEAKAERAEVRKGASSMDVRAASVAQEQSDTAQKQAVAEQTTAEQAAAEQATAEQAGTVKADEAEVARAGAEEQAASEAQLARRAERGAKGSTPAAAPASETDAAAAERAEAATTQGEVVPAQTAPAAPAPVAEEQAAATAPASSAEEPAAEAAKKSEPAAKAKKAAPSGKADLAKVSSALPKAAGDVTGLLNLDVIVSEVNCVGAKLTAAKAPATPSLPKTGGVGMADDIAVAGLGLLFAGSAAAFITRRRRHLSE